MSAVWQYLLRLPADLEERVKAAAYREHIPAGRWITQAIVEKLDRDAEA